MSLRPECVIEQNTNYRGFNIEGSAEVENVEACAILSAETEDASYWTYVTSTKLCWPKSSNSDKVAMAGVVSGNSQCGIIPPTCAKTTECYNKTSDPKGAKYNGCVNHTVSGRACQPWASTTPHNHGFTKSLGGEGNNCRNPDGGPGPWCYTADPNKRWELCEDLTCGKKPVVFLQRKDTGNERGYFSKSFAEYVEGFEANGEIWLGLDKLHELTSKDPYGLKIIMTDFDTTQYVAYYSKFEVGSAEGYQLTVTGFSPSSSTLHDGMKHNNGMNFTTLDTDQDKWQGGNCARSYGGGGWWYNNCGNVRPTGLHRRLKERRKRSHAAKNIVYYSGGERGNSFDSWMEAEFILIPVSYLYGPDGQIGPRQIGSLENVAVAPGK